MRLQPDLEILIERIFDRKLAEMLEPGEPGYFPGVCRAHARPVTGSIMGKQNRHTLQRAH
jgi:hypothetical protein